MADKHPPMSARTKVKYKEPDKWPDGSEHTDSDTSIEQKTDRSNEKGTESEAGCSAAGLSGGADAASANQLGSNNVSSMSTPVSPSKPTAEPVAVAGAHTNNTPPRSKAPLARAQTLDHSRPATNTGAIRKDTWTAKSDETGPKKPANVEWYSRSIRDDSREYESDQSEEEELRRSVSQSSLNRYTVDQYGAEPSYGFRREVRTGRRRCSAGDLFMAEEAGREVRVLCRCGAGRRFLKRLVRGGTTCERRLIRLFFIINGRPEVFMFCRDIPPGHLREAILGAAGGHPCDTVYLQNQNGALVGLSTDLETNTLSTAYTVVVQSYSDGGDATDDETGEQHRCVRPCSRPPPQTLPRGHIMCMGLLPNIELELEPIGRYRAGGGRVLDSRRLSEPHHHVVWNRFNYFRGVEVTAAEERALTTADIDCYSQTDEKILAFMYIMFVNLGFLEKFPISESVLRNFLYEVYKYYNEVPFHNFRHSFCVAQMFYAIMMRGKELPLDDLTILILYVSCICHDLDHPGYNNIYQINARTDLAIRYNDISPLENHHCSVAFRILQLWDCNIFREFCEEQFRIVREGIIRCILATDMARHNVILAQFVEITPPLDTTLEHQMQLLTMVLIKVADISNEVRPLPIAEPWLDRLLEVCMCGTIREAIDKQLEFFTQSDLEKRLGLPITPFMDRDKVTKPTSQCAFIGLVLLPLNTALVRHFPHLEDLLLTPAREALAHYTALAEAMTPPEPSSVASNAPSTAGAQRRSSAAEPGGSKEQPLSPDHEPPGSPGSYAQQFCSETEVDVSEKALKFKISTEGSIDRRSYPSSRKGSREAGLSNADLIRAFHLPSSPSPPPLEEEESREQADVKPLVTPESVMDDQVFLGAESSSPQASASRASVASPSRSQQQGSRCAAEDPSPLKDSNSATAPSLEDIEVVTEQPMPSCPLVQPSTSKSKGSKKGKQSPGKSPGKTSPSPSTSFQKALMIRLRGFTDKFRDSSAPSSPTRDSKGKPRPGGDKSM